MTPSPIQPEAMTDEQLIEAVAVEVMGWKKEDTGAPAFGVCKEHGNLEQSRNETWKRWWYRSGDKKGKGDKVMGDVWTEFTTRGWNPLTDWNHTMEVVGRMQKQTYYYEISNGVHSEPAYCRFWDRGRFIDVVGYGRPQRAICLAALKTVHNHPPSAHVS